MKTKQDYNKLLSTPEWKVKRDEVLKYKGYKCERCGCQTKLQVHHTYYDMDRMPWEYDNESLLVLCKSCHYKEHFTTPEIIIQKRLDPIEIKLTPFPSIIRNALGQSTNKEKQNYLSTIAKICYLFIVKEKYDRINFTPSYVYMQNKYGISRSSYGRALRDLESFGAIKIDHKPYKNTGVVDLKLNESIFLDKSFSMIPSSILETDIYSFDHKLFMSLIWDMFEDNKLICSNRFICAHLTELGYSKVTVLNLLKDLSRPDSGWVNILTKVTGGYMINDNIINSIAYREIERWEEADKYPIYTKPSVFDFTYVEADGVGKIIKNK